MCRRRLPFWRKRMRHLKMRRVIKRKVPRVFRKRRTKKKGGRERTRRRWWDRDSHLSERKSSKCCRPVGGNWPDVGRVYNTNASPSFIFSIRLDRSPIRKFFRLFCAHRSFCSNYYFFFKYISLAKSPSKKNLSDSTRSD